MQKYLLFSIFLLSFVARADWDADEPFLYTGGFPTADVLRKKEWLFAPQGWTSYGATADDTVTVDWLASMFGAPAGYYRKNLANSNLETQHSLEVYALYCTRTVKVNRDFAFNQDHERGQAWIHYLTTHQLTYRSRLHWYFGATYGDYIRYYSDRTMQFDEIVHRNFVNPDLGVAWEYFESIKFKYTLYALYGNTFYYHDQASHKYMFGGGFQFAPFAKDRHPFFSRFRLELNGHWVYYPEFRYTNNVLPFLPVLTWQWTE